MNWNFAFIYSACINQTVNSISMHIRRSDMRRRCQLPFNICSSPTSMPLSNFLSSAIILLQCNNISNSIKRSHNQRNWNKNIIIKYGWSGAHSYLFVFFLEWLASLLCSELISLWLCVCVYLRTCRFMRRMFQFERLNQFFLSASPLQFALLIWKASIDLKMRCLNNTSTVIGYFETMAHRQHSTKQCSSGDK